MTTHTVYIPKLTPALSCAAGNLPYYGIATSASAQDADAVLLPVPTPPELELSVFKNYTVIGGRLPGTLENPVDLLTDPEYLAANAAITAQAALEMILPHLTLTFKESPVLILGWGRIGKILSAYLKQLGIPVSIYARNPKDHAMLQTLGYIPYRRRDLPDYQAIVNTIPAVVLTEQEISERHPTCYLLELASGQFLPAEQTEQGRALPGRKKPEASGRLIAQTVARILKGDR